MSDQQSKAYYVSHTSGDIGEVVFAASPSKAKLMPDFSRDSDFVNLRAVRAPSFDGIDGLVTQRHYIERGYYFGCAWCDGRVDTDSEGLCYNKADEAFCGSYCQAQAAKTAKDVTV